MVESNIDLDELESMSFYHRPLTRRNRKLITELKDYLVAFENKKNGLNHYSRFMHAIELAADAFNARTAESLAEYAGVSSGTIRKIRKERRMPSGPTERMMVMTLLDACDFYLRLPAKADDGKAEWVSVPKAAHAAISQIVELLNHVLLLTTGSNSKDTVLSKIERAELIAVLETALQIAKAPLIEKGFFKRLKGSLMKISKRAAERQIELGLSAACSTAGVAIGELLIKYL